MISLVTIGIMMIVVPVVIVTRGRIPLRAIRKALLVALKSAALFAVIFVMVFIPLVIIEWMTSLIH